MLRFDLQLFGGRGSGLSSGGKSSNAEKQRLEKLGVTGIENGTEYIIKDGVRYERQANGDFVNVDGYGMSGEGEKPVASEIFEGGLDKTAYQFIDSMNYGASKAGAEEKYRQLSSVANGEFNRTDFTVDNMLGGAGNAGPEYLNYNSKGQPTSWKSPEKLSDREEVYPSGSRSYGSNRQTAKAQLKHDLGTSGINTIKSALQKQAQQWLSENPSKAGQKGWKFNGKKWVQTSGKK